MFQEYATWRTRLLLYQFVLVVVSHRSAGVSSLAPLWKEERRRVEEVANDPGGDGAYAGDGAHLVGGCSRAPRRRAPTGCGAHHPYPPGALRYSDSHLPHNFERRV